MSHVTRKPIFGVCDQLRLKPACSATETSQRLAMLDILYHSVEPDVYSIWDWIMLVILFSDDQSLGKNNRVDTVSKTELFGINYDYNLDTVFSSTVYISWSTEGTCINCDK